MPPGPSTSPLLECALVRYKGALEPLTTPTTVLITQQALEILSARDALQDVLKAQKQVPIGFVPQIMELDLNLKQQACKIAAVLNLPECREILPARSQHWWWRLDEKQGNWIIKGLMITVWTCSLGLLADIATRFLSGGVSVVGAAAVAFPSLLALLQARTGLTVAGRKAFDQLIAKRDFLKRHRDEARFLSLLVILGLLVSFWFALPLISQSYYNDQGYNNYKQGQLKTAEENYLKAISLDPDNMEAHYNLGTLYEDLQEFEKARKEYLIAVKGGLPRACNNLARLFIQKREYSKAVALLKQGLQQAETKEDRFYLFKNLGWARFEQDRDREAHEALRTAIGIASYPQVPEHVRNSKSAHCLLAQVLERENKPSAIEHWRQCCRGNTLDPDEDMWLRLAHKKLEKAGQSCETR